MFDVELGRTLDRLLPPELLALRHPALRRDFLRRLVEGQLLAYACAAPTSAAAGR